jgi:hypothetical protein
MSGYIIYDTWQIMNRYTPDDWYRCLNPKPQTLNPKPYTLVQMPNP